MDLTSKTMKWILLTSFFCVSLIACRPKGEETAGKTDSVVVSRPDLEGCYRMTIGKDTATLFVSYEGDSVKGALSYHWEQRDHNDGTIRGVLRDSLLVADYTFQSEGILSVREVVFKMYEDTLLQGYGEPVTVRDTVRFRDIGLLVYDSKHPFVKGCK
jgi:hypothetical protein